MNANRCTIRVSEQKCAEPRAYIVRIDNCPHTWCAGGLWCRGHPACVEHAALIRAGSYETDDRPGWTRHQLLDVGHIANGAWTW